MHSQKKRRKNKKEKKNSIIEYVRHSIFSIIAIHAIKNTESIVDGKSRQIATERSHNRIGESMETKYQSRHFYPLGRFFDKKY